MTRAIYLTVVMLRKNKSMPLALNMGVVMLRSVHAQSQNTGTKACKMLAILCHSANHGGQQLFLDSEPEALKPSHPFRGLPFTGSGGNATMLPATVTLSAVPIIFTVGRSARAFPTGSVKGGGWNPLSQTMRLTPVLFLKFS